MGIPAGRTYELGGRTAIFPARKKGGTAARSQIGRGGSLARSALSAAEERTGGTVADRTFVERSVVVLLASREVRSGKIFDGALTLAICFYECMKNTKALRVQHNTARLFSSFYPVEAAMRSSG